MRTAITLALLLASTSSAAAWDGPELWYERADAASPGGGGIFGTGGQRDHRITCLDCHVDRVETSLALDFQFQPALGTASGDATYVPGQRYRVDVAMQGETLVPPCDPYMLHINNFAAAFENDAGQIVGMLESDSGQSAASCPAQYPRPASGTTALYRDCQTIFSKGDENRTTWTFFWTAPPAGTVRLHYGAVDGDCMMSSLGDAAVAARRTLIPASTATAGRTPLQDPAPSDVGGCQAGGTPSPLPPILAGLLLLRLRFRRRCPLSDRRHRVLGGRRWRVLSAASPSTPRTTVRPRPTRWSSSRSCPPAAPETTTATSVATSSLSRRCRLRHRCPGHAPGEGLRPRRLARPT